MEITHTESDGPVAKFKQLQRRAKELFSGLRELPLFGRDQWRPYFTRTFDVFNQLWDMQQKHRVVLTQDVGLQRSDIGDIASKIGQLYYHYYLRTSDLQYLERSHGFYKALHDRGYYDTSKNPSLVGRKLKFLARYIVVGLLSRRVELVQGRLLTEMTLLAANPASPMDDIESQSAVQDSDCLQKSKMAAHDEVVVFGCGSTDGMHSGVR